MSSTFTLRTQTVKLQIAELAEKVAELSAKVAELSGEVSEPCTDLDKTRTDLMKMFKDEAVVKKMLDVLNESKAVPSARTATPKTPIVHKAAASPSPEIIDSVETESTGSVPLPKTVKTLASEVAKAEVVTTPAPPVKPRAKKAAVVKLEELIAPYETSETVEVCTYIATSKRLSKASRVCGQPATSSDRSVENARCDACAETEREVPSMLLTFLHKEAKKRRHTPSSEKSEKPKAEKPKAERVATPRANVPTGPSGEAVVPGAPKFQDFENLGMSEISAWDGAPKIWVSPPGVEDNAATIVMRDPDTDIFACVGQVDGLDGVDELTDKIVSAGEMNNLMEFVFHATERFSEITESLEAAMSRGVKHTLDDQMNLCLFPTN